jgi:hypothetical protein
MPHQYEVLASVRARLLDREQIGWCLQDADLTRVALFARANLTDPQLGQHSASLAVTDPARGIVKHVSEPLCSLSIAVEQVKRHALGGLRADAGQALQRMDQLRQKR